MDENNQELRESMDRLTELMGNNNLLLENQARILMAGMKQEDIDKLKLEQVFGRNSTAVDGNTASVDRSSRAYKANVDAAEEYNKVMKNYADSMESASAGLKKVFNNIISQDPSRSMAKYSDGLSTLGDAVSKVANNFGTLGKAVGAAVQGLTKVVGLQMEQVDSLLKANDQLAQFGTAGSFTTKGLMDMAHGAGVTSKNMDTLINPIKSLGPALTSLGGSTGEGVKAFTAMAKITNQQREEFQRLGVSQEQLIQNQADYVKLQQLSGRTISNEAKDRAALQKASLEYTESLATLSSLTGQDVDSLKKKQQDASRAVEAQVAQINLETRARRLDAAGRTEEAAIIRKEAQGREKAINTLAGFDESVMKGAREFLSTGTLVSDEAQALARLGLTDELKKLKAGIASGGDAEMLTAKFQDEYNKKLIEATEKVGFSASRVPEIAKNFSMSENSMSQAAAKRNDSYAKELELSRQKIAESKKPGQDSSQDARAKMTTVEIEAGKAMDKLIGSINPLLKGFDALTVAGTLAAGALTGIVGMKFNDKQQSLRDSGASAIKDALSAGAAGALGAKMAIPAATTVATTAASVAAPAAATAAGAAGAGTAASAATAAGTALSKLAGPLAGLSKAAPMIGTVAAVGTGVVDAYQGIKKADKDLKEGKITQEEARVEKGEAVGGGTGTAIGGAAGALKGAAAGAAIGSVVPVLGTAVGGIIGAALGGWLGSKAGKAIGEVAGGGIAKMTSDADKKVDEASKKAEAKKDDTLAKDTKAGSDVVKVSIVKVEDPNLMKALGAMTPMTKLGTSESTGNVPARSVTKSENKSFTFNETKLAERDEKLYKEYLERKKELFDKELESRKKNLPKDASAQRVKGAENVARMVADMQAKEEFAERAEKVGAAKIDRPAEPVKPSSQPVVAKAPDKPTVVAKAPDQPTANASEDLNANIYALEKQRERFEKKGPATGSAQSELAYKRVLQQMDRAIANEKAKANAPKAAVGGIFDGPKSGYPVELHGKEMITPLGTGTKTASLDTSNSAARDEELEKEIEAINQLRDSLKESDTMFTKLSGSIMKLNKIEEDKIEKHEEEADKLADAQDKLKNVFKGAELDLSKFSGRVKVLTDTAIGTGATAPAGGTAGGTGVTPQTAPSSADMGGGTGVKPPTAPPMASMGGGTGVTAPPVKQDVKQNLGDVKAALMKRGMGDEKYLNAVLGNVMKESGGKVQNENLNYGKTSNDRIRSIFGSRARGKTDQELNEIKSSPESMGEFMYGKDTKIGRSMGNLEPGDGFKYRGRGYIQLTGKSNYAAASQAIFGDDTLVKNPDLVNDPKIAADVVAWYMERGKSSMAKKMGIDDKNMTQEQANLLATSQIAGTDVRKAGGYLGGEVMNKVAGYAASKDIQDIKPSEGGTMVAGVKKDDIPKAQRGGVFDGPESGYLVELHGPETVIPNDKIASIAKKELESVVKMSGNVTTGGDDSIPAIDTTDIAKKSVKLFSEEMGPTFAGINEYTGYNSGPMTTDLKAVQGMASKVGAYDEKTQTITDTDAWKKILHSGIATNYDMGLAKVGTEQFGPDAGNVLGDRLKEIMEMDKTSLTDAIKQLQEEFRAATQQMVKDLAQNAAAPAVEGADESVMAEVARSMSELVNKMSESNDIQGKILQYSQV